MSTENKEESIRNQQEYSKYDDAIKETSGDYVKNKIDDLQAADFPKSSSQGTSYRSIYNPCNADTHTRIFGECPEQQSPRISHESINKQRNADAVVKDDKANINRPLDNDDRSMYAKKPADGNPLTGEGYGNQMADPRVKHPPGGFSQGLW